MRHQNKLERLQKRFARDDDDDDNAFAVLRSTQTSEERGMRWQISTTVVLLTIIS
jgi:hypothetical protein